MAENIKPQNFTPITAAQLELIDKIVIIDQSAVIERKDKNMLISELLAYLQANLGFSSELTQDLNVIGVTVGNFEDGDVIPSGTSLEEVFTQMLTKVISPTYISPTVNFTGPQVTVEAGTNITPQYTSTFTTNDSGGLTSVDITREINAGGPVVISTGATSPFSYTDGIQIGDDIVEYRSVTDYATGPVKNNNLGDPDPTGQIVAGTIISLPKTYTGKRRTFWGTNNPVTSSNEIRSLGANALGHVNGSQFTINVPIGATSIEFAYPATLSDPTVNYVELFNADVTGDFTETAVNVEGANGFAAIAYKVFQYTPDNPFETAATYVVTI